MVRVVSEEGTGWGTRVTIEGTVIPLISEMTLRCSVDDDAPCSWRADVKLARASLDVKAAVEVKSLCLQLLQLLPVSVREDLLLEVIPSDVPAGHARFHGLGGWPGEASMAAAVLEHGKIYRVTGGSIGQSTTALELEGVPGNFNSAMFDLDPGTCPLRHPYDHKP